MLSEGIGTGLVGAVMSFRREGHGKPELQLPE
jgi:hypothetical protein